jgi:Domain of unknown function (DUF4399)
MFKSVMIAAALTAAVATGANAQDASKAAADAKVMILEPANGATVSSPVTVKFGLKGMEVSPAGTEKPNSGHHHLLINQKLADPKVGIPADDKHKHYGKGQTEDVVTLPPGTHTLQLVLADHNHVPHSPLIQSEVITITVK